MGSNDITISAAFDLLDKYASEDRPSWFQELALHLVEEAKEKGWCEGWQEGGSTAICDRLDIWEDEPWAGAGEEE